MRDAVSIDFAYRGAVERLRCQRQLIALLRVGEETGKLEDMFANLANQYNDSVDARTALIGSLLEPVLIIGLGILVGFILVAMYLPLFQMSTSVG